MTTHSHTVNTQSKTCWGSFRTHPVARPSWRLKPCRKSGDFDQPWMQIYFMFCFTSPLWVLHLLSSWAVVLNSRIGKPKVLKTLKKYLLILPNLWFSIHCGMATWSAWKYTMTGRCNNERKQQKAFIVQKTLCNAILTGKEGEIRWVELPNVDYHWHLCTHVSMEINV